MMYKNRTINSSNLDGFNIFNEIQTNFCIDLLLEIYRVLFIINIKSNFSFRARLVAGGKIPRVESAHGEFSTTHEIPSLTGENLPIPCGHLVARGAEEAPGTKWSGKLIYTYFANIIDFYLRKSNWTTILWIPEKSDVAYLICIFFKQYVEIFISSD